MKAFRFTLEAVRIVRQRQEHETQEQYAHALLARRQAVARVEEAQRDLEIAREEWRTKLSGGCPAAHVSHAHAHRNTLEKRCDECAALLGAAERRVNAALQAMLAARRQREIVDKFLAKQKARYSREFARVEQKM